VKCKVPGCKRSWVLEGSAQGFVKAAAMRHADDHHRKYEAQKRRRNS
jgi:hypothetical protein